MQERSEHVTRMDGTGRMPDCCGVCGGGVVRRNGVPAAALVLLLVAVLAEPAAAVSRGLFQAGSLGAAAAGSLAEVALHYDKRRR